MNIKNNAKWIEPMLVFKKINNNQKVVCFPFNTKYTHACNMKYAFQCRQNISTIKFQEICTLLEELVSKVEMFV